MAVNFTRTLNQQPGLMFRYPGLSFRNKLASILKRSWCFQSSTTKAALSTNTTAVLRSCTNPSVQLTLASILDRRSLPLDFPQVHLVQSAHEYKA